MRTTLTSLALTVTLAAVAQTPVYLDEAAPIESRVSDALSRMTVAEKVALCHAQSKFTSAGCPRLGIPQLTWSDASHGVRPEINWNDWGHAGWTTDSCTAFPALTCLAATWDPALARLYGESVGDEARYRGKSVLLGPGLNLARTPLCGRNFEYLGEDPWLTARMCVPYIEGLQSRGVAASVKHYALNNQELWRGHIDVRLSERALRELYLPAFEAAAREAKAWTFMSSYNKTNGMWLAENRPMLRDILKKEWQWDGVVVSDWGGTHSTVASALAGLDVEMGSYTNGLTSEATGFTYDDYYLARPYREALAEGKVPMSILDEQAARILRLIFRTAMNRRAPFGSMCTPEHYTACRRIAAEGAVLLKNERNLLPIDGEKYRRILVVGENATRNLMEGGGSSELKPKDIVTPLAAITRRFAQSRVTYAEGYRSGRPQYDHETVIADTTYERLRREAVLAAADADLIIYVGGMNKNWREDCENGERQHLELSFRQNELLDALAATRKPVVGVFISGCAFAMPWEKKLPAIVEAWYGGTMGGQAIADVLSGDVNPSGRLPISFPRSLADVGAIAAGHLSYPGDSIQVHYTEDLLIGYRWHLTKRQPALFPFGHGLSYTTFRYGKAEATPVGDGWEVTVAVTNTGSRVGSETVQLYVERPASRIARPLRELKAFRKVSLEPGQTVSVKLAVPRAALRHWDTAAHAWAVEPGKADFLLAASSTDIRKRLTVNVVE